MVAIHTESEETIGNPLDLVEQVAVANEWPFHRQTEDELAAEISGHWCQYRLWFCWHPDLGVMHLSCAHEGAGGQTPGHLHPARHGQ